MVPFSADEDWTGTPMLLSLTIRDVVLIEQLSLSFASGLAVLTGETGAGKSILLDSLGLALGMRAESGLVRPGADRAVVTASFEVAPDHPLWALLSEQDLEADPGEPLVLRRSLGADGRSRAFVNDQSVSVGLLRQLGEQLVEVHGQFDDRGLMDATAHRRLLDAYHGDRQVALVADRYRQWREAVAAEESAKEVAARDREKEAFLRQTLEDLEQLAPEAGEADMLAGQRQMLMNSEKIAEALVGADLGLTGDQGADAALGQVSRRLERVAELVGPVMTPVLEALDRAMAETQEASAGLASIAADLDAEPGRLEQVEERLFALREMARRHAVEADDLPELTRTTRERLASLTEGGGRLARLGEATAAARAAYLEAAERLQALRRSAAASLTERVNGELPPLKLERARFEVAVTPLPEPEWGAAGTDRVSFLVSTNPGAEPGPLGRIASGGERARFLLALRVALAATSAQPVMVFDEVDSGVGGAVAEAVGERLSRLGRSLQVLVVTHSPQVAAAGDCHYLVLKQIDGERVRTDVERLGDASRREEVARMLSGARITDEARAAADRLLERERA